MLAQQTAVERERRDQALQGLKTSGLQRDIRPCRSPRLEGHSQETSSPFPGPVEPHLGWLARKITPPIAWRPVTQRRDQPRWVGGLGQGSHDLHDTVLSQTQNDPVCHGAKQSSQGRRVMAAVGVEKNFFCSPAPGSPAALATTLDRAFGGAYPSPVASPPQERSRASRINRGRTALGALHRCWIIRQQGGIFASGRGRARNMKVCARRTTHPVLGWNTLWLLHRRSGEVRSKAEAGW